MLSAAAAHDVEICVGREDVYAGEVHAAAHDAVGVGRAAAHDDEGTVHEDVDAGELRSAAHDDEGTDREDVDVGKVCTTAHDDVGAGRTLATAGIGEVPE